MEFVGAYAQTAGLALIGIEMFDQVAIDTPVGIMSLDNQAIEDFLDGAPIGKAFFEIRAYDSEGKKTMLAHLPVTIVNDGIDDEVSSQIGAIATRVDTVYVYPPVGDPDAQAAAIAKLGTVYTNPALAQNFVFTHNFSTMAVDVVVLVKTGAETWQIVPDDQYEVDILNDSQVQLFFADDVPAAPSTGSVQVWICTLAASPILNNHRHSTDAIDGVTPDEGRTLTQIIAQLRASLPTGWPNIPANKIVGTLSASQIDVTGLAALQQTNAAFLNLFRLLASDSTVVSNIAKASVTNSDFVATLSALFGNADLLTTLMGNLGTNADFTAAVKLAVGSMQIPGTMQIPIAVKSEILFTTETDATKLPDRAPYMLPQVISPAPANLPIPLPNPTANTAWINNTGGAILVPGGGMIRSANILSGGGMASDGRILFAANKSESDKSSYYPSAFERELWRLWINEKMLPAGKTLTIAFAIALQLAHATSDAQWCLVVEQGTAPAEGWPAGQNLESLVWDTANPLVKQRIILTESEIIHAFGAIILRSAEGLTAKGVYYSNSYDATAPDSANFVLRARLMEFDTENSIPNSRGWVSYRLLANSYGELGAKIA